jgi:hypothetical protein
VKARVAAWFAIAVAPLVIRSLVATGAPMISWTQPLFSSTLGLLSLTPVLYIALAGMVAGGRRDPARAATTVAVLGAWVAGATLAPLDRPNQPFSHGLTAAVALLAPGLVVVIEGIRRRPWPAVALLVGAALAWNHWLMVQYTIGRVPKDAPVSFRALVRQQADIHTRPPYLYPFAFPANAWFAWREGLPIERFELLAFEPRRATVDLPLTPDAARFLLEGWEPPAPESTEPLVWTRDRRATIALPLALPEGRPVDIVIRARARLDHPPVTATLGVEVNGHEVGRIVVPPAAVADLRLPLGPEVGVVFRAGYNRLTLVSHSVARVDSADTSPPGPMASRLGDRPWPVAIHRIQVVAREP